MKCDTGGCTREAAATVRITMGAHHSWQGEVCLPCQAYYLTQSGKKWHAKEVTESLFDMEVR